VQRFRTRPMPSYHQDDVVHTSSLTAARISAPTYNAN
jgi:hypothetical protein